MTKRTAKAEKQARVKALMAAGFTQREAESLYMAEIAAAFTAEVAKRRAAKQA
jgi:hypothetical protein